MPSLLTPAAIEDIKTALKDVTDTFMVTPVEYYLKGESMDRSGEDHKNRDTTTYNISALVEHQNTDDDEIKKTQDGAERMQELTLTCNLRDLKTLNLVNNLNKFIGKAERDYFKLPNGEIYKVILVLYDGPLDVEPVLVIIKGAVVERIS